MQLLLPACWYLETGQWDFGLRTSCKEVTSEHPRRREEGRGAVASSVAKSQTRSTGCRQQSLSDCSFLVVKATAGALQFAEGPL